MKIRHTDHRDRIDVPMTPMIDIVFQLLVFFIMSFKIVLPEGDFNIRMPLPANDAPAAPSELPVFNLRMTAGEGGGLEQLSMDSRVFEGEDRFAKLHSYIRGLIDDSGGPGTAEDQEVEINADYDLHYDYVMRAITALSGYLENGQRHQLIEKIRLTPPTESE
ncbi:Biopolymer transport protein ExbD/TolR [Botrimarina colliarenosi]|uniref:Biopolymer transport protein ExbD/TolR n=1 Tax=Botrimarina colliarenosi TaxID=2528001 RepID=A0A5C6ALE8_9BACT|nr:biopolymer transporter ExbD [Botrimarina colliarenosi]TWU00308.1 Biopolymer transport protein ExbD/TolR [Botrimarina colliarenosi]